MLDAHSRVIPPAAVEVAPGLIIGRDIDCPGVTADAVLQHGGDLHGVVHACKTPCHAKALGYELGKAAPKDHPGFLIHRTPGHLVLNMIDADEKFFRPEFFIAANDFIAACRGRVLVHCNQGASRSPSIALVYLAKRTTLLHPLERATYDAARKAFLERYPAYTPGKGIAAFLDRWWERIR